MPDGRSGLRILHCFRAPLGGLFRHVRDLARAQEARGHSVGVIADASSGGEAARATLDALAADLTLGVHRVAMPRHAGPGDLGALRAVGRHVAATAPDVLHGHGAKGGAYARLAGTQAAVRVYTPHGGSLHYTRRTPVGLLYLEAERLLARRTDIFLFESAFGRQAFEDKVGPTQGRARVVHNGLPDSDFEPVRTDPDAADFLFVGELRELKGVSELLRALALLHREGRAATAVIGGDGPDAASFVAQAEALGLGGHVVFSGARPARELFAAGRCLVVPSRAESLPYIVLEGGAARLPMVATNVGGIPEIFGAQTGRLVPPRQVEKLARAMRGFLLSPDEAIRQADLLQARIRERFSLSRMAEDVLAAYSEACERR